MAKTATKDTTPAAPAAPEKKKSGIFGMLDKIDKAKTDDGSILVPVADIGRDPEQPRKEFDQEKLENLAESIRVFGVIQPLTVRRSGSVPPYVLVAGERRWRAAQIAQLADVPVFIRDDLANDAEKRGAVQLVENANREDLSDYEIAKKIQDLIDTSPDPSRFGLKSEIARSLNMKPADISRLLAMLNPDNRDLVESGLVGSADALARLRACPEDMQAQLVKEARESGEPITSSTIRTAKALAAKPAPTPAVETASPAAQTGAVAASAETGEAGQHETGGGEPAAAAAGDGSVAGGGEGVSAQVVGDADPVAPFGGSSSAAGDSSTTNEDDDADADADADTNAAAGAGHSFGGSAGGQGGGSSSNAGGSATPRAKAVSVATTGEGIEVLLRYLVDKSSDRLEVRMPADLAIAVIEKLKGEVPEDPNAYGQRIKDLLTDKLSG